MLCKELQEEGYVLDKDFVKDNKRDIMLMAPEDINSKYDSDDRHTVVSCGIYRRPRQPIIQHTQRLSD